jgi:hypothetical protein
VQSSLFGTNLDQLLYKYFYFRNNKFKFVIDIPTLMKYRTLMQNLGGQIYTAVNKQYPGQLFCVLDALKRDVERHSFDNSHGLGDVLRNYPRQQIGNLTFWVEGYVDESSSENEHPLATTLVLKSNKWLETELIQVVSTMNAMLVRDGEFGYSHRSGSDNMYRLGLEQGDETKAYLDVFHKFVSPYQNQMLIGLDKVDFSEMLSAALFAGDSLEPQFDSLTAQVKELCAAMNSI